MAKKKLTKPQLQTKTFYNYNDCRNYLEKKYGYDERDYAKKFQGKKVHDDKPYLDFWHWVIDHNEVHNGCFISFERGTLEYITEEWVKEIYTHYLDEFADEKGEIVFYVWW
jgi:hypothetical protein